MNTYSFLTTYGLETLLKDQDDPRLWESALSRHWQRLDDPSFVLSGLRFCLGRKLEEGQEPQGEKSYDQYNKYGMLDVGEWAFEKMDEQHLRVIPCPPNAPALPVLSIGSGVAGMMGTPNFSAPVVLPQIKQYLGLSRPSRGVDKAVVFSGVIMPGASDGKAMLWKLDPDGSWQETDQCITRWLS